MVVLIFRHGHGAGQAYGPTHPMSFGNTRALGIGVWSFFFFDTYMVKTSIVIIKIARRETRKYLYQAMCMLWFNFNLGSNFLSLGVGVWLQCMYENEFKTKGKEN